MSTLPLLPQPLTGARKRDVFIRGWWNNNRVEKSILDLQSDIGKLMRRYMASFSLLLKMTGNLMMLGCRGITDGKYHAY